MSIAPTIAILAVLATTAPFEQLEYRNPGLVVDLGVGLWAWPLPMDYDGDGDLDLVVSCPDKPSNGIWFFENPGGASGDPIFEPARRLARGSSNIRVSYLAGKPIVTLPGKAFPGFRESGLEKPRKIAVGGDIVPEGAKTRAKQWQLADLDGDGVADLIAGVGDWSAYGWDNAFNERGEWTRGPLHGWVMFARGVGSTGELRFGSTGELRFDSPRKLAAGGTPIDVYGMPSPCVADFDRDGDFDLICGEFRDGFTWFENTGSPDRPEFAAGRALARDGTPIRMPLCMIVPTPIDWDGDGDVDLVVGQEDGRVAVMEHTGHVVEGMPIFEEPRFLKQKARHVKYGALVTPVGVDWDGDGDDDLVCGNTAGTICFLENLDGGDPPRWAAPVDLRAGGEPIRIMAGVSGSIQGPAEAKWGYTVLDVADWDHDGLPDIVTNSIWGEVLWYRNIGSRRKPELAAAQAIEVEWEGEAPRPAWNWWRPKGKQLVTQWRTSPIVRDINRDGLNDLVMLDHEGYLALFERARGDGALRLLPGRRVFRDADGRAALRLNPRSAGKSGRRKLCLVDWNLDGAIDLLANSANVDLLTNVATSPGEFRFRADGAMSQQRLAGHTTCPTTVDWDRNGVPDLVVGAEDGFIYYQKNQAAPKARFEAEHIFEPRSDHNHAPGVVECPNGDLLASWYRGSGERRADDVAVWGARLRRGEKRWSEPFLLADHPRFPDCNTALFIDRDDRLWLFWPIILANTWESCLTYYRTSTDYLSEGPPKWSWQGTIPLAPKNFKADMVRGLEERTELTRRVLGREPSTAERAAGVAYVKMLDDKLTARLGWQPRCKPTQLPSGRILMPLYSDGYSVSIMAISDDGGATWFASKPLAGYGNIQPAVLRRHDGTLVAYMRENGPLDRIRVSESRDDGVTWGAVGVSELPNPGSGLDGLRLKSGRWILVYNDSTSGRHSLAISMSDDEGKTWRWTRHLENDASSRSHYPAVTQGRDGRIHVVYSHFLPRGKTMKHAALDEAWIEAGNIR